jgi:hypothetical protein
MITIIKLKKMKKYLKQLTFVAITFLFFSCTNDNEKFSGSPADNSTEVTPLVGTLTTDQLTVVSSQNFPVTITIPQSFEFDVTVEVTSRLVNTTKKTVRNIIIPAGQTTVVGNAGAPSSTSGVLPFNNQLEIYLTAINSVVNEVTNPTFGFKGKQYSLTSDKLIIDYGDTSYTNSKSDRLSIVLDNLGPSGTNGNNLNFRVTKDNILVVDRTTTQRFEKYDILKTAPSGTYVISIWAQSLVTSPVDLPYRFALTFPNEDVRSFGGVLPNLTVGTALTSISKLQIIKSSDSSGVTFLVTAI